MAASPGLLARIAGWYRLIFATWLSPVFDIGLKRPLEARDLPPLPAAEVADYSAAMYRNSSAAQGPRSVLVLLFYAFWRDFLALTIVEAISVAALVATPVVLEAFLSVVVLARQHDDSSRMWRGSLLLVALMVVRITQILGRVLFNVASVRAMRRIMAALRDAIYRKSMVIASCAAMHYPSGEILQLHDSDVEAVSELTWDVTDLWSSIAEIAGYLGVLFWLFGPSVLFGIAAAAIMVPINYLVFRLRMTQIDLHRTATDSRTRLVSDALAGIRLLKICAWESLFWDRISTVRARELACVQTMRMLDAVVEVMWLLMPGGMIFAILMAHGFVFHKTVGPATTFTAILAVGSLTRPMFMLPHALMKVLATRVNTHRISLFLSMPERVDMAAANAHVPAGVVAMEAASFEWTAMPAPHKEFQGTAAAAAEAAERVTPPPPFALSDLNLELVPGELCAVIGAIGQGKSSLLAALLGDMALTEGRLRVGGRLAYVAQAAWIQSGTVRDNVIFGLPFDQARWDAVVFACALTRDIAAMPGGPSTLVGERGMTLSGGQRQRIALARACYANADVVLLDDPLAAVDAACAAHLFDHCLSATGYLAGKTRVLVTHHFHVLSHADRVVLLDGGRIVQQGRAADLMSDADSPFAVLLSRHATASGHEAPATTAGAAAAGVAVHPAEATKQARAPGLRVLVPGSSASEAGATPTSAFAEGFSFPGDAKAAAASAKAAAAAAAAAANATSASSGNTPRSAQGTRPFPSIASSPVPSVSDSAGVAVGHADPVVASDVAALTASAAASVAAAAGGGGVGTGGDEAAADDEDRMRGAVGWHTWRTYMAAGGTRLLAAAIAATIVAVSLVTASDLYLGLWASSPNAAALMPQAMAVFGALLLLQVCLYFAANVGFMKHNVQSSANMHDEALRAVLDSPMLFFESTSAGRILSRFTRDTEAIDNDTNFRVRELAAMLPIVLLVFVIVAAVTPIAFVFSLPFLVPMMRLNRVNRACKRELSRLSSMAFAPLASHITETLRGAPTLRAFTRTDDATALNMTLLSDVFIIGYCRKWQEYWTDLRVELCGNGVLLVTALYGLFGPTSSAVAQALTITNSVRFVGALGWAMQCLAWLEAELASVERLAQYAVLRSERSVVRAADGGPVPSQSSDSGDSDGLALPGPARVAAESGSGSGDEERGLLGTAAGEARPVVATRRRGRRAAPIRRPRLRTLQRPWTDATIDFEAVAMRYRPTMPLALRGLTFSVRAGEHVAVVGRTGAGKSSVTAALLRLVELDSGAIRIGGVDVAGIPLAALRSSIAVIPQDAVLFIGTLRENMDPLGQFPPAELEAALAAVGLPQLELELKVTEGAVGLSQGQIQLVCMARALLRRASVLVLDEATSSCDPDADAEVQRVLRSEFAAVTVLTVAHRLNTIMDYDRVLVLDAGRVAEYDTPRVLAQPPSMFAAMIDATGPESAAHLRTLVRAE